MRARIDDSGKYEIECTPAEFGEIAECLKSIKVNQRRAGRFLEKALAGIANPDERFTLAAVVPGLVHLGLMAGVEPHELQRAIRKAIHDGARNYSDWRFVSDFHRAMSELTPRPEW